MFQLRAEDQHGNDTGECTELEDLQEAMEKFLEGGFWKLSWTTKNGKRVRLLQENRGIIEVTYMDDLCEAIETEYK